MISNRLPGGKMGKVSFKAVCVVVKMAGYVGDVVDRCRCSRMRE
jgi:hypothetical protein